MKRTVKSSRKLVRGTALIALASACLFAAPDRVRSLFEPAALAAPMTFVVNTTDDADDGACNPAHCSLREAIKAANTNAGADTINFNIPGAGVRTITPATALPSITDAVTIDGYSQPGASVNTLVNADNAVLLIELSGAGLPCCVGSGLAFNSGSNGSTVKGLVINRFVNNGINIAFSNNNVVEGNFIGTDPTGTVALGGNDGIFINGGDNIFIGGTSVAESLPLIVLKYRRHSIKTSTFSSGFSQTRPPNRLFVLP